MRYLIVFRRCGSKANVFKASSSRNSIKLLKQHNAQVLWIYDDKGNWVSYAERDKNGKPYRPKMYPDGEPRKWVPEYIKAILSVKFAPST